MADLADVLTDFHPTAGRVAALEPVAQAHVPFARDLTSADSRRLGDLLSSGSLNQAAVDASIFSYHGMHGLSEAQDALLLGRQPSVAQQNGNRIHVPSFFSQGSQGQRWESGQQTRQEWTNHYGTPLPPMQNAATASDQPPPQLQTHTQPLMKPQQQAPVHQQQQHEQALPWHGPQLQHQQLPTEASRTADDNSSNYLQFLGQPPSPMEPQQQQPQPQPQQLQSQAQQQQQQQQDPQQQHQLHAQQQVLHHPQQQQQAQQQQEPLLFVGQSQHHYQQQHYEHQQQLPQQQHQYVAPTPIAAATAGVMGSPMGQYSPTTASGESNGSNSSSGNTHGAPSATQRSASTAESDPGSSQHGSAGVASTLPAAAAAAATPPDGGADGGGMAVEGTAEGGNRENGTEGRSAEGETAPEGIRLREEEQQEVDLFVNLAWDANYKEDESARLEFKGASVGARTTGRLMAAAASQLMKKGAAAVASGECQGLNPAIRTAIEKALPDKRSDAQLDGSRRTVFLAEALRQITDELMKAGVDPRDIIGSSAASAAGAVAAAATGSGTIAAAAGGAASGVSPSYSRKSGGENLGQSQKLPQLLARSMASLSAAQAPAAPAPAAAAQPQPQQLQLQLILEAIQEQHQLAPPSVHGGVNIEEGVTELLQEAFKSFIEQDGSGGMGSTAAAIAAAAAGGGGHASIHGVGGVDFAAIAGMLDFPTGLQFPPSMQTGGGNGGGASDAATAAATPQYMPYQRIAGSITMIDAWVDDADIAAAEQHQNAAANAAANGGAGGGSAPADGGVHALRESNTSDVTAALWGPSGGAGGVDKPSGSVAAVAGSAPTLHSGGGGGGGAHVGEGNGAGILSAFAAPSCISPPPSPPRYGSASPYRLSNAMSILRQTSNGLGNGYMDMLMSNEYYLDLQDPLTDGRLPSIADKFLMSMDVLPNVPSMPSLTLAGVPLPPMPPGAATPNASATAARAPSPSPAAAAAAADAAAGGKRGGLSGGGASGLAAADDPGRNNTVTRGSTCGGSAGGDMRHLDQQPLQQHCNNGLQNHNHSQSNQAHGCPTHAASGPTAAAAAAAGQHTMMYDLNAMARHQISAPPILMSGGGGGAAPTPASFVNHVRMNGGCDGHSFHGYDSIAAAGAVTANGQNYNAFNTSFAMASTQYGNVGAVDALANVTSSPIADAAGSHSHFSHSQGLGHGTAMHMHFGGGVGAVGALSDMASAPVSWEAYGGAGAGRGLDLMASAPDYVVGSFDATAGNEHMPTRARSMHGLAMGGSAPQHPQHLQHQVHTHANDLHAFHASAQQQHQQQQALCQSPLLHPRQQLQSQHGAAQAGGYSSPNISGSRRARPELDILGPCEALDGGSMSKIRGLSDPDMQPPGSPFDRHSQQQHQYQQQQQQMLPQLQMQPGMHMMGAAGDAAVGGGMPYLPYFSSSPADVGGGLTLARISTGTAAPLASPAAGAPDSPPTGTPTSGRSGRGGGRGGRFGRSSAPATSRSPRGAAASRGRGRGAGSVSLAAPPSPVLPALPSESAVAAAIEELMGVGGGGGVGGGVGGLSGGVAAVAAAAAVAAGVVAGSDDGLSAAAAGDGSGASAASPADGTLRRSRRENRGTRLASLSVGVRSGRRGRGGGGDEDDEDYDTELDDDDALSSDSGGGRGGGRGGGGGLDDDDGMGGRCGGASAGVFVDEDSVLVVRAVRDGVRREITKGALRKVYHLPINEAAAALNIGVTVLKKYCRKFRVPRWPYRKLQSMAKLIESFQRYKRNAISSADLEGAERCEVVIQSLLKFRDEVYDNPDKDIDEGVKKLRQANFKIEYRQRQGQSQGGTTPSASGAAAAVGSVLGDFETLTVAGDTEGAGAGSGSGAEEAADAAATAAAGASSD